MQGPQPELHLPPHCRHQDEAGKGAEDGKDAAQHVGRRYGRTHRSVDNACHQAHGSGQPFGGAQREFNHVVLLVFLDE